MEPTLAQIVAANNPLCYSFVVPARSPQRYTVRMLADALNLPPDERAAFVAAARRLSDPAGQPGA